MATFFIDTRHAKFYALISPVVFLLSWLLDLSQMEWIIIILCVTLVWVSEMINSAIEYTVDLCSPEFHPLAKKAKDVAAGAVTVMAIVAAIIGLIIFIPKCFLLI